MREILQMCIELDRMAYETYQELARSCGDAELASHFDHLAAEERTHVDWWTDLLGAWEAGLVPDIADEHHLIARLVEMRAALTATLPLDCSQMSVDETLDFAAHLEFYMLDPLFGELIDLMQPGSRADVRKAYSNHVLRLVDLIERRYSKPGVATFLAGVLKRAFLDQQRLTALVVRDQLTGLYNRRGVLGYLSQWLAWSQRYGRPVGIALLDIDHFKRINDMHGHAAGDDALSAVARVLDSAVRSSDIVGRYGGDEFLVLAPEADGNELRTLMERLVADVSSRSFSIDGVDIELSVSAGGAWVAGGAVVSSEEMLASADRSMYAAKESGRNRAGAVTDAVLV